MSGIGISSTYSLKVFRSEEGPLIDIRSPKEFEQGHWPEAINFPLFDDEERALIGTTYKRKGRNEAILLGLNLTFPKLSNFKEVLKIYAEKSIKNQLKLYCWRGGLRSSSLAWYSSLLGIKPIVLEGGYKTYRRWAIQQFEKEWPLKLLGGKTGTGKTEILLSLKNKGISTIDLEGLAIHKGSSFGGLGLPKQPSSEQFENMIAEQLLVYEQKLSRPILLEAESANLGSCRIPKKLFNQMQKAPLIEIKRTKKERVEILVKEYGNHLQSELKEATLRIKRRLGPQRTEKALEAIISSRWDEACIAMLDYYDKCYEYELAKKPSKEKVDISGMNHHLAAEKLIELGYVY